MKKTNLILFFLLLTLVCKAPEWKCLYINRASVVNYYQPLIDAVTTVESLNGVYTWNPKEEAVGWFQIRQIRVDHYNLKRGTNYKLEDFFDYNLSKEMFLYYAKGKTYEKAAKDWNGSGPLTAVYWGKIQKVINN